MSFVSPVRALRAAFVFLTRLPVGGFPYTDDEWRWAPAYFPLVGLALGAALGGIDHGLQPLGPTAAALGTLAVSLLATGALHEDGLADTSDALGGGFDRDKILLILKDSRIGSFGASALVISIAGRAALLARLGPEAAFALTLVAMAARTAPVWQIAALSYVTGAGGRSAGVARARWPQAAVASWLFLCASGAMAITGHVSVARMAALAASMTVVTLGTSWRYQRRLGGITGDFLGATEQLCELAGLGALALGSAVVTTLFAARHAAVSVEGICYGQSDVPTRLDDASAGDLLVTTIEALAPRIQRVWASPWQRTRGPAAHVCARLGLPLVIDARLSELSFGAWEGRRYAELERETEFQDWMAQWQSAAPPRGETVAELLARVGAWRTEVLGRGEVALAISHAGVIRALRAQAQAVPYASLMGDAVEPLAVEAIWRQ